MTAYVNLTTVRIVKTHQQIDHRGLTTSGRSDDRHPLSRQNVQIKIFNQFLIRQIGKIHMLHRNTAVYFV